MPDVAELTWTLPGGAVAGPFPAFMDTATERGTGSIRRIDDGDLANGPCGVAFSYGDEVLAEGTITLACPP